MDDDDGGDCNRNQIGWQRRHIERKTYTSNETSTNVIACAFTSCALYSYMCTFYLQVSGALNNLAAGDESKFEIAKAGVIAPLIHHMRSHDTGVATQCAACLATLAEVTPNQAATITEGGLRPTIHCMRSRCTRTREYRSVCTFFFLNCIFVILPLSIYSLSSLAYHNICSQFYNFAQLLHLSTLLLPLRVHFLVLLH